MAARAPPAVFIDHVNLSHEDCIVLLEEGVFTKEDVLKMGFHQWDRLSSSGLRSLLAWASSKNDTGEGGEEMTDLEDVPGLSVSADFIHDDEADELSENICDHVALTPVDIDFLYRKCIHSRFDVLWLLQRGQWDHLQAEGLSQRALLAVRHWAIDVEETWSDADSGVSCGLWQSAAPSIPSVPLFCTYKRGDGALFAANPKRAPRKHISVQRGLCPADRTAAVQPTIRAVKSLSPSRAPTPAPRARCPAPRLRIPRNRSLTDSDAPTAQGEFGLSAPGGLLSALGQANPAVFKQPVKC